MHLLASLINHPASASRNSHLLISSREDMEMSKVHPTRNLHQLSLSLALFGQML